CCAATVQGRIHSVPGRGYVRRRRAVDWHDAEDRGWTAAPTTRGPRVAARGPLPRLGRGAQGERFEVGADVSELLGARRGAVHGVAKRGCVRPSLRVPAEMLARDPHARFLTVE